MATREHTLRTIDLARLSLAPGQGKRVEIEVDPGRLTLGGIEYGFEPSPVRSRLDVSRTASGFAMRLSFSGELTGACVRCLEPARRALEVEAREVDQPGTGDEDLRSPYVDEGLLDVSRWAHDALALAVPQQILCRPDCAGLCPECGRPLNDLEPDEHVHEAEPDPRWAKLRELEL